MTFGEHGSNDDHHNWPYGAEVERRLEALGLSANAAADIAGLNKSTGKNIIKGRRSNGQPYTARRGPKPEYILAIARVVDEKRELSDDDWLRLAGINPARYRDPGEPAPDQTGKTGRPTALVRRITTAAADLTPRQQRALLAFIDSIRNPEFTDYGDTELRTRKVVEERKAPPLRRVEPSEDADSD